MKNILIIVLFLIILFNFNINEKFNGDNLYKKLRKEWSNIFPDGNRNAGGALFFKYILDNLSKNYAEFIEYNKYYCSVSGSLVNKGSTPDFIKIRQYNSNNFICGNYYRCCYPCSCDLMKYAMVKKHFFKKFNKNIYLLVIKNPCSKNNFPDQVNKSYFCKNNNKINDDKIFKLNNNLIAIGILHNAKKCTSTNINEINSHFITGKKCEERNEIPLNKLKYGMGNIFINLAK